MGGTLTRDEWFKLREGADTPRGVGNTVIPLAHQMTEEQRLGNHSAAKLVQDGKPDPVST